MIVKENYEEAHIRDLQDNCRNNLLISYKK